MEKEILIVQLSDIHFKVKNNSIEEKLEKLYDAVKNEIGSSKNLFIIVTGDISNTGSKEEFDIAHNFFTKLEEKINHYCNDCKIHFIFTPGNHDCDFSQNQDIREIVIDKMIQSPESIKDTFINQCVEVQKNYFDFIKSFDSCNHINQEISNSLLTRYEFQIDEKAISFNSFNLSWISTRKEQQARLFYPTSNINIEQFNSLETDYTIALFHHPFQWLNHANARTFKDLINKTSDVLFTGHEHASSGVEIKDMERSYTIQHIEAAALQENNHNKSSFNLFKINLEDEKQVFTKFVWENTFYKKSISNDGNIIQKKKSPFSMKSSYMDYISKLAIKVNIPYRDDIVLSDIFIYPDLKIIAIDKENDNSMYIEKNSSIFKEISSLRRTIVYGSETSGKSSLLRMLQIYYYKNELIPLIIDCADIESNGYNQVNIKKYIFKVFKKQYKRSGNTIAQFEQLDKDKIIIFLDGFEKVNLNNEYKGLFVQNLELLGYSNILITSHEHLKFEATTEGKLADILKEWNHFSILELGYKLRSKLIKQWIILGQESSLEKAELLKQVRERAEAINKTIGYNIVPAYPIYIMTLLQAMEVNAEHNLSKSSYGHYYHYLIMKNLQKAKKNIEPKDINTIFGFTSSFAFEIFQSKKYIFSIEEIKISQQEYCINKKFNPSFDILNTLIDASIIIQYEGKYKFTHNFIYYYFVATYFADNYTKPEVEKIIFKMMERLYRTEFANILMFILHLTPQDNIITQLINESKKIFNEIEEFRFSVDEVKSLNNSIKKDFITCNNKTLEENHEEELEKEQKKEVLAKKFTKEDRHVADYDENIQELELFTKINLSFKMIEILGEILKNYSGTLDGSVKYNMISETHSVGLRALKSLMDLFEKEHQNIILVIKNMVEKKQHITSDKIDEDVARLVYSLASNVSTNVIKKIAKATASKELKVLLKEVFEIDHNNNAKLLIEQAIELDFESGMNIKEIEVLYNKFKDEKNNICNTTLRKLVLDHLYMYNIPYDKKQSVCQKLNIDMNESKTKMINMKR